MKFSEAREYLTAVVAHNIEVAESSKSDINDFIVPGFFGDPGVGKTAIPKAVAKDIGITYFQTIVAQYDAGEMAGLPFMGEKRIPRVGADGNPLVDAAGNQVFDTETQMIRLRPSYLPDIHDPNQQVGVYNLDELPQAFLANQNICSQLVNEWRVGEHMISRGITICCTGNKPENKAGTTSMPTHLRDRINYIEIEADCDEWLTYASSVNLDIRIRAYLKQNPGQLHKFNVGANASPTPRSWEKTSSILKMDLKPTIRTQALTGQIGAYATEFETWLRVEDRMPRLEDVINNPDGAPVFGNKDADINYLLLTALADVSKPDNIGNIIKYIRRLPNQEFASVWAKDAFTRDKSLLNLKVVTEWKMKDGAKLIF